MIQYLPEKCHGCFVEKKSTKSGTGTGGAGERAPGISRKNKESEPFPTGKNGSDSFGLCLCVFSTQDTFGVTLGFTLKLFRLPGMGIRGYRMPFRANSAFLIRAALRQMPGNNAQWLGISVVSGIRPIGESPTPGNPNPEYYGSFGRPPDQSGPHRSEWS